MNLCAIFPGLLLVYLKIEAALPKQYHRSIDVQNDSVCEECAAGILFQSRPQHVSLRCGANSTYCPSNMVSRMPGMTWTFWTDNDSELANADERDFCVIPIEDDHIENDSTLKSRMMACRKTNMIVTYSTSVFPGVLQMQLLFVLAGDIGIVDIIIVVQSYQCLVYTHVPYSEDGSCFDTSPILAHTWTRDLTCSLDNNATYFPEKINNLYSCDLHVKYQQDATYNYWYLLIDMLSVAMGSSANASASIGLLLADTESCRSDLPLVGVANEPVNRIQVLSHFVPSYFFHVEYGFAVPRVPTRSILWLRLFNELSVYVWLGVSVSFLVSTACLYVFLKGEKDIAFVILFTLQPLLGGSRPGNFLSSHARIFFLSWLLFSFIIDSSYLCSLLSHLTAPSNADAIKSLKDLIESKLPIFVPGDKSLTFDSLFSSTLFHDALQERTTIVNFTMFLQLISESRNDCAFSVGTIDFDHLFVNTSYKMLPDVVSVQLAPLFMCEHSPYQRLFHKSFLRALGAGALEVVSRDFRRKERLIMLHQVWKEKGPQPLTYGAFQALFALWALGCTASLTVCAMEYVYHKYLTRSIKRE